MELTGEGIRKQLELMNQMYVMLNPIRRNNDKATQDDNQMAGTQEGVEPQCKQLLATEEK